MRISNYIYYVESRRNEFNNRKIVGSSSNYTFSRPYKAYQIVYAECLATDLELYCGEYNKERQEINKIAML